MSIMIIFLNTLMIALTVSFLSVEAFISHGFALNNKLIRNNNLKLQAFSEVPAGNFNLEVVESTIPVVVDFSADW